MKILVFYFSGTGNTRWAVEQLQCLLQQRGHTAILQAAETVADLPEILQTQGNETDYIAFAAPVYAANLPRIVRQCLQRVLETGKVYPGLSRRLILINTFGYVNAFGVFAARKLLRQTPFTLHSYVNLKMTNSAPQKLKAEQKRPLVARKRKQKAGLCLLRFIKRLEAGKKTINGIGPQLLGGIAVRAALRKPIADNYKKMHVNMQTCTRCMHCVQHCPVQCITYQQDAFVFTSACEACMRCYHGCPVHAISNA